jgi:isoleucyl-tRNA synthetase
VRASVNGAIEPLRAAKTMATTAEAEVTLTAPPGVVARLRAYGPELGGFLMVAGTELIEGEPGQELAVAVRRTSLSRCERCWTYRPDVAPGGPRSGLCARCVEALEAPGR